MHANRRCPSGFFSDAAKGHWVTPLYLYNEKVDPVFHLLGTNENAITKSLG